MNLNTQGCGKKQLKKRTRHLLKRNSVFKCVKCFVSMSQSLQRVCKQFSVTLFNKQKLPEINEGPLLSRRQILTAYTK